VQQPTKFQLAINLDTAKALGVAVSLPSNEPFATLQLTLSNVRFGS
jgi:hypothetical protein